MGLKRGFKTDAEAIAKEIRAELGLKPRDPLDPWKLAEHLDIPVLLLSALQEDAPSAVDYLLHTDTKSFSAATVFDGRKRMIVYNDAHSRDRQASNLAHEIAHALLLHPPTPPLDEFGCRNFDGDLEDEAKWLAGALLVTEAAAVTIAFRQLSDAEAALLYSVSEPMMRYRLNVTGARKRAARKLRSRAA